MSDNTSDAELQREKSPRGEFYLDDRTPLAYVYDGSSLVAILFDKHAVDKLDEDPFAEVVPTPAGREVIDQ